MRLHRRTLRRQQYRALETRPTRRAQACIVWHTANRSFMIAAHNDTGHRGYYAYACALSRAVLVALCRSRTSRGIRAHLSHMPTSTDLPNRHSANRRDSGAAIRQNVAWTPWHLSRSSGFALHRPRPLFAHTLSRRFRMLRKETAQAIGDWIFQDILLSLGGTLVEIVSDNGKLPSSQH